MEIKDKDIRDAFFDEVYEIASEDKDVIFITADADAFSLKKFRKDFPDRFINAGVAEQNMVTVAAGLALSGKKVFVYALIPFVAFRCYEHIKTNICGMNLPVTIVGAGAGLSFGNDGPTHHAIQDIAVMRTLPELFIYNPCDAISAQMSARLAYESGMPSYIRLDKGKLSKIYDKEDDPSEGLKVVRSIKDTNSIIISTGYMIHRAIDVVKRMKKQNNINIGVIDIFRLKPIDKGLLLNLISHAQKLITLEENYRDGGLGSMIIELLIDRRLTLSLRRIGLPNEQIFSYGSRAWLLLKHGLGIDNIVRIIQEEIF